jgi:hypothetical protein
MHYLVMFLCKMLNFSPMLWFLYGATSGQQNRRRVLSPPA